MNPSTPVTEVLEQLGIPYRLHLHLQPLRSLEQAARERGLEPEQIVRSLIFRLEDGSFVLLLMPGPGKVSWPKLRDYLNVSRVTTARLEEVERVTGYPPGAVSPLGLTEPMRILADRSLLDLEVVSIGAGITDAGVELRREDLTAALELEFGDFQPRHSEGLL